MLRTAESPTSNEKTDLEGEEQTDEWMFHSERPHGLRERSQSRQQRGYGLVGEVGDRSGSLPSQPALEALYFRFILRHGALSFNEMPECITSRSKNELELFKV
jgi:hypothetical protein